VWRIAIFNMAVFPTGREEPEAFDITYIDGLPHYYAVEDGKGSWEPITDGVKDQELFIPEEQFELRPDDYPGLEGPIPTTVGRYVFNWIVIWYAFGTRLPYLAISQNPLE
ncbi:hypothetical protein, partial [Shigella flexneri]|uniref:hypothetical protein n=1 Tax=Shigella flexneri TaxID=623 RepID=UPI001C0A921D